MSKMIDINSHGFIDVSDISDLHKIFVEKMAVLNECIAIAENPNEMSNEIRRIMVFTKLSYGLRRAGEALSWAYYHQKNAKAERKRAEAIAALDNFSKYAEKKKMEGIDIKTTDKTKEYYISIDEDVKRAYKLEAYCDALVENIVTIKYELSESIRTLRSMYYGQKDANIISGFSSSYSGD